MSAKNMDDIAELFKGMKFRKKLLGGVSEMDVWKKLEQAADAYLQQLAQPSDAAEPIKEGEQA